MFRAQALRADYSNRMLRVASEGKHEVYWPLFFLLDCVFALPDLDDVATLRAACEAPDELVFALAERLLDLRCERVAGARRRGSATFSMRPGAMREDLRWLHAVNCSTLTLKRSATATSVSPRFTL